MADHPQPVVTPPGTENPNDTIVQTLREAGIAIILLDRDVTAVPNRSDLDLVAVDHLHGLACMAEYLVGLGRKRFAFWIWRNAADTVQIRAAGIRQVLAGNELPIDPQMVRTCDPDDPEQVAQLIKLQRPDVVMCANDVFAAHLMKTMEQLKIQVPQDVCIVGYDDVRYSHLLSISLTTISQPCEMIAGAAVQLMVERIWNPEMPAREVILNPNLAIRDSTGPRDSTQSILSVCLKA